MERGLSGMSLTTDFLAGFALFSRQISYTRDGTGGSVPAFVTDTKSDEVAGDFTSTTCVVTIPATSLSQLGLFPAREFDRVELGDGIPRTVSKVVTNYIQNVPQWVRVTVSG